MGEERVEKGFDILFFLFGNLTWENGAARSREKVNDMLDLEPVFTTVGGLPASDSRKVGGMKGHMFIADGHEVDDDDDEIAQLFDSGPDNIPG